MKGLSIERRLIVAYVKLTDCEELVMKCVWDAGRDISLVETMSSLQERFGKEWKRQTVATFLLHLIQKGYVTSYRAGRVFYYRPEIELEEYKKYQTKAFLDFWYDGSVQDFMSVVQANGDLKEEEAENIKHML